MAAINATYAATSGNKGGVVDSDGNTYVYQGNEDGSPISTADFKGGTAQAGTSEMRVASASNDLASQWKTGGKGGENTNAYLENKALYDKARAVAQLTPKDLEGIKAGKESWGASRSATTMKIMACVDRAMKGVDLDKWNKMGYELRSSIEAAAIPQWLIDKATHRDVLQLEDSNYHPIVNLISQAHSDFPYHDAVARPTNADEVKAAIADYAGPSAAEKASVKDNGDGTVSVSFDKNDDFPAAGLRDFVTNSGSPIPHDTITVYGANKWKK